MHSVPQLLEKQGDIWDRILDHKNDLLKLLDQANAKQARSQGK